MQQLPKKQGFRGVQNTNGRTPGAINVITREVRKSYQNLIENNMERLQDDLDRLDPKDRLKILIELSKFIIPTMKSVEVYDESENRYKPLVINFDEWK
jgi:hypothetical protein